MRIYLRFLITLGTLTTLDNQMEEETLAGEAAANGWSLTTPGWEEWTKIRNLPFKKLCLLYSRVFLLGFRSSCLILLESLEVLLKLELLLAWLFSDLLSHHLNSCEHLHSNLCLFLSFFPRAHFWFSTLTRESFKEFVIFWIWNLNEVLFILNSLHKRLLWRKTIILNER